VTRLVRAELFKLRTTRDLWWTAAATLLLVVATVALTITSPEDATGTQLNSDAGVRTVLASASAGSLLLLLLGIASIAGEFRHGTATTTFLVAPDRHRTLLAKVLATMLVGVAIAAAAIVLTLAVAVPWLDAEGVTLDGRADDVAVALLGSLAITPLAAAIGVGLGALLRNQTTAVVTALVWTVAVESLVAGFVPELYRFLPGGAFAAVTGSSTAGETFGLGGGLLLSLAYAVGFALAGRAVLLRRELA
jgi:ABC-type transport system involved in multi-copper enzyme maturation permease subunit